jgi:hypothetical protein
MKITRVDALVFDPEGIDDYVLSNDNSNLINTLLRLKTRVKKRTRELYRLDINLQEHLQTLHRELLLLKDQKLSEEELLKSLEDILLLYTLEYTQNGELGTLFLVGGTTDKSEEGTEEFIEWLTGVSQQS